jgi:hypothetical protein
MLLIKVEFIRASMFEEVTLKFIYTSAQHANSSETEMIFKEI